MLRRIREIAIIILVGCAAGCSISVKDSGGLELFFGTSIGVRSTSATTNSTATTTASSQPLEDWIRSRNADATTNGDPR